MALIYVQNSITMPHLVVIQLMRVIKWPRSHSHGNCVNKNGRGYKGFYSTILIIIMMIIIIMIMIIIMKYLDLLKSYGGTHSGNK